MDAKALKATAARMVSERDVRMYGIDYRNGTLDSLRCGDEARKIDLSVLRGVYLEAIDSMDARDLLALVDGLKRCPRVTP